MEIPGNLNKATTLTTVNLVIRGITLAGKFVLIIFLAKHLTSEQLGVWGIFTTSIALSLYLVGLDFYTYSARSILEYEIPERSALLRDQLIFYLISYAILFPLLSLLFVFNVIEFKLIIFFYIILIFEHLAQESYRTFVVFSKPVIANIILFLRTGLWAYILVFLWMTGFDQLKNLKVVFLFWIGGGSLALITSLFFLSRFPFKPVRNIPINWKWIRKGVRVSLIFLIGTVGYKIIEFSDRYFIDYYHTKDDVGIYTFFAMMTNGIEIFVQTAVVIFFSPRLIATFHTNNYKYHIAHVQFSKQIVLFTILAAALLAIFIVPLIHFINKEVYFNNIGAFIFLAISEMLFNFSLIFHYILYVRKNDLGIIKAILFAAFTNILLNFILVPPYNILGAAISTTCSFLIILLMKAYYARNLPEARRIIFLKFMRKKKRSDKKPA